MNTAGLIRYKSTLAALVFIFHAGAANSQLQSAPEDPNTLPQVSEQPGVAPLPAPLPVPDTPPAPSPFDYRSSEEISEDRSVSFPVDI
jgi:hypothetical protein